MKDNAKMQTVENNHLFVRPTADTANFIDPWLRDCPLQSHVNTPELHISILYAKAPLVGFQPDETKVYECRITGAQVWYDVYLNIRDFIVLVDSPAIIQRQADVIAQAGVESIYDTFTPHFTLAYNMPLTARKKYRWWMNEIMEKFSTTYKDKVLTFDRETLSSSTGYVVPSTKVVVRNPAEPVDGL